MRALNVTSTPKLVRLNPNIPFKTRGNGAVSFEVDERENTKKEVMRYVKKYSQLKDPNTNPGIAFVSDPTKTKRRILSDFYQKTMTEYVSIEEAEEIAARADATLIKYKNGRGVIGALAACGATFGDKTYELLAYRVKENFGKKRMIDVGSVFRMNERLYPNCFDNVDTETGQILITPRGRDPVFCGIRGETTEDVHKGWEMIKPLEEIAWTQVFETNQATDAHLTRKRIGDLKRYDCVIVHGVVSKKPQTVSGGHVLFTLQDATGVITCCAYRQSRFLRKSVSSLMPGDTVTVYGGIGKHEHTLNIEKLSVEHLAVDAAARNPTCHGRHMTSMGTGKGFRCRVCKVRAPEAAKVTVVTPRTIALGCFEPPPSARRHLSKPLIRGIT